MSHDLFLGDAERFAAMWVPEPNSGCWLWLGNVDAYGYGVFSVGGKKHKAHRVSWGLHRGPIPDGLSVCHRCDNPPCVNTDHLFVGTAADNSADKVRKHRQASGPGRAPSLPPAIVDELLRRVAADEKAWRIADDLGISRSHAYELVGRVR